MDLILENAAYNTTFCQQNCDTDVYTAELCTDI